jgi:hypothetical protein
MCTRDKEACWNLSVLYVVISFFMLAQKDKKCNFSLIFNIKILYKNMIDADNIELL